MNLPLLVLLAAAVDVEAQPAAPPPRNVSFAVSLGSSHWVGQTFGTPLGISTPALTVSMHPGLRWLELGLRYSLAIAPLELPGGGVSRVGFVSLEVLLTREMRVGDQRFELGVGPAGAIVHSGVGPGFGGGPVLFARYLIDLGPKASLGPFFAMRPMFYLLPHDSQPREDLQADLGVVATF